MTIRKTIKRLRREQRKTKKILRFASLQFYKSRSDRAQYVNRSMVYVDLNIARTRRSLRYKAQFNRRNKHQIIFVEEPDQLTVTGHIHSGKTGFATKEYLEEMGKKEEKMSKYLCTLVDPPAPMTLRSEEVEVNIGPMKLIENFSGPTS